MSAGPVGIFMSCSENYMIPTDTDTGAGDNIDGTDALVEMMAEWLSRLAASWRN